MERLVFATNFEHGFNMSFKTTEPDTDRIVAEAHVAEAHTQMDGEVDEVLLVDEDLNVEVLWSA
jgi:hypothetical protein